MLIPRFSRFRLGLVAAFVDVAAPLGDDSAKLTLLLLSSRSPGCRATLGDGEGTAAGEDPAGHPTASPSEQHDFGPYWASNRRGSPYTRRRIRLHERQFADGEAPGSRLCGTPDTPRSAIASITVWRGRLAARLLRACGALDVDRFFILVEN